MPMTAVKFVPYEMKSSIVRFFSYEDKNPTGVLVNPFFGHDMPFNSTLSLLFLLDELQDGLKFPQESMVPRTFIEDTSERQSQAARVEDTGKVTEGDVDSGPTSTEVETRSESLPIASFKINIMFRQNASWQGNIVWLDSAMESKFRSVLELLFLIDSVLENRKDGVPHISVDDDD
ncbi:MAG: hypothetical protein LBN30_08825 [Oscillospiraceae bacterium]|jgi:hypothetical protein|nr:hypothetical protein [Oscillospiraceae bacterium]